MDMSLSRNMPRSRTDFAGLTISPQTENVSLGTKCCWWFEAHPITSVLAAFSCKRFGDGYSFCIHDSMSQHTDTGNPLDTWPTAAPFLPGLGFHKWMTGQTEADKIPELCGSVILVNYNYNNN